MILVGNQRGGSKDLALHLLKDENERVEVHEIRGFASRSLLGAFQESYAISRATRCKQHLYSLSLSPPKDANISNASFEDAIGRAEERLGLAGQPRAIVFHEKRDDDGVLRRHAHAVWCRIDTAEMKARQLSFTHTKLQSLARELYLEHEWEMPRGFMQKGYCDPRNFTLAEWQQAKRRGKNPKHLKALLQDAWAISDDQRSFANGLLERGFILARGDRRGYVAVDHTGEAYSVSRWVGVKAKEVRAHLGNEAHLPSVEKAQRQIAELAISRLDQLRDQLLVRRKAKRVKRLDAAAKLVADHAEQMEVVEQLHIMSLKTLEEEHATRFRTGLFGLLDRLSGRRKRIAAENQREWERLRRAHQCEKVRLQIARDQSLAALNEAKRNHMNTDDTRLEIAADIDALGTLRSKTGAPRRARRRAIRSGPARK